MVPSKRDKFADRINDVGFIPRELPALLAVAVPLLAQTPPAIRVDVNLVRVPCIVTQANGAPAKGLHPADFDLRVDGSRQEVKYVWQENDLPLTVVLIADVSCTQRRFAGDDQKILSQFLERVLSTHDHAAIVAVTDQARLVTDLTDSLESLQAGARDIDGIHPVLGYPCSGMRPAFAAGPGFPCGSKALWNAVFFSAKLGLEKPIGRKAMLILTDGMDTGSDHPVEEAIAATQHADAMVYAIRFLHPAYARLEGMPPSIAHWMDRGKADLDRLAHETGGDVFDGRTADLTAIFNRIEADLRNQYVLGFTPADVSSKRTWHEIRVKTARPGLKVRAQERYYAQ